MPSRKQKVTILVLTVHAYTRQAKCGESDGESEVSHYRSHSPVSTGQSQEALDRQNKGLCSGCYQCGEPRHIDHMWFTCRLRVGSAGQFPAWSTVTLLDKDNNVYYTQWTSLTVINRLPYHCVNISLLPVRCPKGENASCDITISPGHGHFCTTVHDEYSNVFQSFHA